MTHHHAPGPGPMCSSSSNECVGETARNLLISGVNKIARASTVALLFIFFYPSRGASLRTPKNGLHRVNAIHIILAIL